MTSVARLGDTDHTERLVGSPYAARPISAGQPGFQSLDNPGEDEVEIGELGEFEEKLQGPPDCNIPPGVLYAPSPNPTPERSCQGNERSLVLTTWSLDPRERVPRFENSSGVLKNPELPNAHSLLCSDTGSRLGDNSPSLSTTGEVKQQRSRHEHENATACRLIRSTR